MWFFIQVVIISLFVRTSTGEQCSNPSAVTCISSETAENCPEETYFRNNVRFGNCCPGCVDLPTLNGRCIEYLGCQPPYSCNATSAVCEEPLSNCLKALNAKGDDWKPKCLPDGTYAPKQCKGELLNGKCFCYDADGNRTFGEANWNKADNMLCSCSRLVSEILKDGGKTTLHCNDLGNYEELQCDQGICWCGNEMTGMPYTSKVPDTMMKILPCYVKSTYGDKYLRQCDSIKTAQDRAKKLMTDHGTISLNFPPVNCNYDGSYARVQIIDNKKWCVGKDKIPISEFAFGLNDDLAKNMSCNCVYDRSLTNGPFVLTCKTNGNYEDRQVASDGTGFCVDTDGFEIACPEKPAI